MEAGVEAAQPGPHGGLGATAPAELAFGLELGDQALGGGTALRPEDQQRGWIGDVRQGAQRQLDRAGRLEQHLGSPLGLGLALEEGQDDRAVAGRQLDVEGQRLLLERELGVEGVADQGMKEPGPQPGAAVKVLLARREIGAGHLRGHLVEGREDVVGGHHHGFGVGLPGLPPGGQDGAPGDLGGDPVGGQHGLDRLRAAGLVDAQLGHPAELLGGRCARVPSGRQEEVEARFAGLGDGFRRGRRAGRVVPPDLAHDGPRHMPREARPPALDEGHQGSRQQRTGLGRDGLPRHLTATIVPPAELAAVAKHRPPAVWRSARAWLYCR